MIFGGRMAGGECQPLAFADVRWQGRNRPPGLVVAGRRVISAAQEGRPRQDSNLRTRLRRPHPCITPTCTNTPSRRSVGRAWGGESLRGRPCTSLTQGPQLAPVCIPMRMASLAELDAYLAALDAELGPVPGHELDAACQWADAVLPADRTAQPREPVSQANMKGRRNFTPSSALKEVMTHQNSGVRTSDQLQLPCAADRLAAVGCP